MGTDLRGRYGAPLLLGTDRLHDAGLAGAQSVRGLAFPTRS